MATVLVAHAQALAAKEAMVAATAATAVVAEAGLAAVAVDRNHMSSTKSERIRAAGGTGMCFARPERGQRHQRRRQLG